MDIESQIRVVLQRNRDTSVSFSSSYTDIYEGSIYNKFYHENEQEILNRTVFSLTLNSDSISLCSKSSKSIWPVIFVINELPAAERFCFENIIIGGKKNISIISKTNLFKYERIF
jgi:hypothetical protein